MLVCKGRAGARGVVRGGAGATGYCYGRGVVRGVTGATGCC